MAYTKTNWQDLPNQTTPVNASNLNKIENELESLDNGQSDLQEQINDKNILTVGLANDVTFQSSSDFQTFNIPLTSEMFKVGTKLSINNGKVVIGAGVSKILVSANCMSRGSLNTIGIWICKNGNTMAQVYNLPSSQTFSPLTISPFGINVTEGDIIDLLFYFNNSGISRDIKSYSGNGTYLTVEVIE